MEHINLIAQIDTIRTTKDGGYKITLECGQESLKAITDLMNIQAKGDQSIQVSIIPYNANEVHSDL